MSGLAVARVAGIEVRLHLSWIFIVAIITATAGGRLSTVEPAFDPLVSWVIGAVASIGFMVTVVAHELAHAIVIRRAGGKVDAIVVHFIGSPAVVDVREATPRTEAAVALAGPLTSLGLGIVLLGAAFLALATGVTVLRALADAMFIVGALDVVLALISLVPAFPLDGGRVVRAVVWRRTGDPRAGTAAAATVGRFVGRLLIAAALAVIVFGDPIDGIMLGLVGWFLGASARSVDRWLILDELIAEVSVSDAMEPELETISPQLTLDTFAAGVLDGRLGPALPVVRNEELLGIVGASQLRAVPRRNWPSTRTMDVMVDLADLPVVTPDAALSDGLEHLRASRLDGLPVVDATGLRGVLTRRSISVALRVRADLHGMTL